MKTWKWIAALAASAGIAAAGWLLGRPCLFGETREGFLFIQPVSPGTPVVWSYRHSVMKTPVWEYLVVNPAADGLAAVSTKYQSYGAGLPSLAGQGTFRQEGSWFILDFYREFPSLSIRNGVTNEGVLTVGETSYILAEQMPLGAELHLYVAPLCKGYWLRKEMK